MAEGEVPELNQVSSQVENKENLPRAFIDSELIKSIDSGRRENGTSGILFTDIDGTFRRRDSEISSADLFKKAQENKFPIVAVTGNNFSVIQQRIESGELPYFEAIAGSVGTELYVLHLDANGEKTYIKDDVFEQKMLEKGFDRVALNRIANKMVEDLKPNNELSLDFQKPEIEKAYSQGEKVIVEPFKISFYAFASSPEALVDMRRELSSHFPGQKVVICEESDYNEKLSQGEMRKRYCIDVLPVTKADVVDYVGETTNVDVKMVAGDGGNDEVMLTGAGDVSIAVGGLKPDLRQAIQDVTVESSGRGSFKKVQTKEGKTKYYYSEKGNGRLGPDSILYATEVLLRAQRMAKMKSAGTSA